MMRVLVFFFCLFVIPLRANLGETVEQCVARYGVPIGYSEANPKSPFGTVAFAAGGYTLVVFVLNNHEVGARVSKQNKSAFSDAELKTIMAADAGGSSWTSTTSPDPTCISWTRSDRANVLYDKDKHVLIFTAKAMADALHSLPLPPATHPAAASPVAGPQAVAPKPAAP